MRLLKKVFGLNSYKSPPSMQESVQSRVFLGRDRKNPFPSHRDRILEYDAELVSVAATGNHEQLSHTLRRFLAELNMYNSNVSRFIATPVKNKYPPTSHEYRFVNALYLEHNRHYIGIRRQCKNIIESSTLLAFAEGGDGLALLNESQNDEIFGALRNIEITIDSLKNVWDSLSQYENSIFRNE